MAGYNETPDGAYRVEVIADNSGKWCSNGLRFPTIEDAKGYGADLAWRWTLVREWRVVEVASEVVVP